MILENDITTIDDLKYKVSQLCHENTSLHDKVTVLEEQLDWFRRQIFGQKSEKAVADINEEQLLLEGFEKLKTEEAEALSVGNYKRKKNKRKGQDAIQIPENLPVETTVIDIPEEEKVCQETGKPLVKIGEEVSHKLAHKPGSFYIKEIIRPKYAFPKGSEEGIRCAELPDTILPRCRADESLLAEILVRKFADHAPLYRTEEIFARDGIRISRQLLSQWVLKVGLALDPLYIAMRKSIIENPSLYIDESPVSLLKPGKGKVHKAYMWVLVGGTSADPPYRIYSFRENRKHDNAKDLLKDYKGIFHSDKYGAYEEIAANKDLVWCPCWVHVRRKFFEAESGDVDFRRWILRKIRYLFMFERIAWSRSPEERLRIRQEKEVPIIDELIAKIKDKLENGSFLPKSNFCKALNYFYGLKSYLKNYTHHAHARMDNNVAERAIRPLAIGRKNWMFFGSVQGGRSAATILSLIQTCRNLGVNPRTYLEDVMRRIMSHSAKHIHELLPDRWVANRSSDD